MVNGNPNHRQIRALIVLFAFIVVIFFIYLLCKGEFSSRTAIREWPRITGLTDSVTDIHSTDSIHGTNVIDAPFDSESSRPKRKTALKNKKVRQQPISSPLEHPAKRTN